MALQLLSTDIERLIARLQQHGVPPDGLIRVRQAIEDELAKLPVPEPARDDRITQPGTPSASRRLRAILPDDGKKE